MLGCLPRMALGHGWWRLVGAQMRMRRRAAAHISLRVASRGGLFFSIRADPPNRYRQVTTALLGAAEPLLLCCMCTRMSLHAARRGCL